MMARLRRFFRDRGRDVCVCDHLREDHVNPNARGGWVWTTACPNLVFAPCEKPECCSACGGRGATNEGHCWDCFGTGHPHNQVVSCNCPGFEEAR